jgi:hypothetical protein
MAEVKARPVPNSKVGRPSSGRPSTGRGCLLGGRTTKGGPLGSHGLASRCTSSRRRTLSRAGACLPRERGLRRGHMAFALECFEHGARTRRRRLVRMASLAQSALGGAASTLCSRALLRSWKTDACLARLRQPDGDRLFRRACTVLALTNVIHLFADELACLCRWSPAGAFCGASSLECGLLWHTAETTQILRRVSSFQRQPLTLRAPRGSLPVSMPSREV